MPIRTDHIHIEFSGHLHNRQDLLAKLGLATGQAQPADAALLLKAGWRNWGEGLAEHLLGDYALAIRDETQRIAYLVRDPLGVKPLYYRIDKGVLSYGFSIPELRRRCPLPVTQDMDWAARYMLGLSFSTTDTAYKEIHKVPPGHWLSCDGTGRVELRRYHHWRDNAPHATRRDPRWVDAYRDVLEEAIRCRMDLDAPMGTENSGGIDSATITAYLAHFLGEPGDRLHSFGFALREQEPAFILETSQAQHIRHNYLFINRYAPNIDGSAAHGFPILGYPQEHANATGHIPFYEECQRRGIRSLFSGFGGDEVVTNHGRHLRHELLDGRHYAALWGILPGDPVRRSLGLIKALATQSRRSSHHPNFLQAWHQRWPNQLVRPEVAQRLNLYEQYMETAIFDAPYRRINDLILLHHLKRMKVTARLEDCTLMAAAYGVDYRWPLWDVRLVQQYLSTPSIEKVGPKGIGRYLHRRAIDTVVPRRVAWKPSKDMGYGRQHQTMKDTVIIRMAEQAQQFESGLHPAFDALIDRDKWRQQIARAIQGQNDDEFAVQFSRSANAIAWLDQWLNR